MKPFNTRHGSPEVLLEALTSKAIALGVYELVKPVLTDDRFFRYPGSSWEKTHHFEVSGLLRHTYEVATGALTLLRTVTGSGEASKEAFIGAVWHDFGKTRDYSIRIEGDSWFVDNTTHKFNIYHITRSAIEFEVFARTLPNISQPEIEEITHIILSHHGQKAWGSPVEPKIRAAWAVHLADMASARMDDSSA